MCNANRKLIYAHVIHVLVNCPAVGLGRQDHILVGVIANGFSTGLDDVIEMIFFIDNLKRFGDIPRLVVEVSLRLLLISEGAGWGWSTTFASGGSLFPALGRTAGFRADHHFRDSLLLLSSSKSLMPIIWTEWKTKKPKITHSVPHGLQFRFSGEKIHEKLLHTQT